jgi:O-antigen/teichoic acid export membrane protein
MQAAVGISLAVRFVFGAAHSNFLTPNVNRGGAARERMEWANRFQLMFSLLAGVILPPLLLFPGLAVDVLYTPEFAPGAAFLAVFVLVELALLVTGTYQSLLVALDHTGFYVVSNVVAHLLVVCAAAATIGPLGILGAGLSAAAAPVFLSIVTTVFLRRRHGLHVPAQVVVRTSAVLTGLAAAALIGARFTELTGATVVTKLVVYVCIVAGLAFTLNEDERKRATAILRGGAPGAL